MNIKFEHGSSCDSYEEQANRQGFTLGNKAKLFDRIAVCSNFLYEQRYLTDDQIKTIRNKIQEDLINSMIPVENSLEDLIGSIEETKEKGNV